MASPESMTHCAHQPDEQWRDQRERADIYVVSAVWNNTGTPAHNTGRLQARKSVAVPQARSQRRQEWLPLGILLDKQVNRFFLCVAKTHDLHASDRTGIRSSTSTTPLPG